MATMGLSKKIGGVELKWWIIGGVGAAGIVWYTYKRSAATAPTTIPTDDTGLAESYGDYSGFGDTGAAASGYAGPSSYGYFDQGSGQFIGLGGQTTVTAPPTNGAWFQQSMAYLGDHGYDPLTAGSALGQYLLGGGLSQDQLNIVQAAIGAEGIPPNPVPAPHLEPPTSTSTSGTLTGWKRAAQPHMWITGKSKKEGKRQYKQIAWEIVPSDKPGFATPDRYYIYANGQHTQTIMGAGNTTAWIEKRTYPVIVSVASDAPGKILMSLHSNARTVWR